MFIKKNVRYTIFMFIDITMIVSIQIHILLHFSLGNSPS